MAQAIGDILTPALGVALSPFPIVAVILMLTSGRGRAKGLAFALGWIVGLAAVVGLLLLVAARFGIEASEDGPSTSASVIRLLLGAGVLVLAARKWQSRPQDDDSSSMPGWMASIERAGPLGALGFGIALAGLNPKNLLFNLIAGTAIASSGASTAEEILAWSLYILFASLTVILPVAWYLMSPSAAAARLEQPRQWLIRNNTVMVAMILLLIGVSQVGEAISALGS